MNNGVTIQLSGVSPTMTEAVLMNMYRTYGPILRVKRNDTNAAHVTFERENHARKAVGATNGAVMNGETLNVSILKTFTKSSTPCRGFAAGKCHYGDLCKYLHVTDNAEFARPVVVSAEKAAKNKEKREKRTRKPTPEATQVPVATSSNIVLNAKGIPEGKVCHHFARGFCSQGSACGFAHIMGGSKPPELTGKVARICQFFASGVCTRGDACRFVHLPKEGGDNLTVMKPTLAVTKTPAAAPNAPIATSNANDASDSEDEEAQVQDKDSRTCIECEKPGVAVWKCAKCDGALYCDDCNGAVHKARVMAKHKRTKLPPVPKLPRCGECESNVACVRCEQCDVPFCAPCDASVHKFKSLRKHVRVKLNGVDVKSKRKTKEVRVQPEKKQVEKKKEEFAHTKKEEKKKEEKKKQVKPVEPVPYVESVPQLDFSSDESSDSEDEEETNALVGDDDDESMPLASSITAIADDSSKEAESDEDFDDVKPNVARAVITDFVAKVQPPQISEEAEDEEALPKPIVKASAIARSIAGEVSSDSSDESECEAPSKPAVKSTPTVKPTVDEMSSESSDDEDVVPFKSAVKTAVKPTPAPKPVVKKQVVKEISSSSSDDSSDDSDEEVPSKPATKPTPVQKSIVKKADSSSSSESDSSDDSSEDEAPAPKMIPVRRVPAPARNQASGISEGNPHTLVKKIEVFNESGDSEELHLDANLNGFERLLAHDCAERLGLAHESTGTGLERHIIISRRGTKRPAANPTGSKSKKSKHHY
ncbi:hypothetical protein BBO99_00006523 [Phytophthora kernoviae]|uniref:RING-type E3 ubiquitin transferase n=1 Tax=Phytophthora kernoviae TaxID=325452 RepID=A0A3R7H9Q8_9STRA|nr:hypothetical protein BBI17_002942 [Phytophthora kernoviae]RLN77734.1 hypothetical protein BBO99_00006523 [Phytophthora kernoviae]